MNDTTFLDLVPPIKEDPNKTVILLEQSLLELKNLFFKKQNIYKYILKDKDRYLISDNYFGLLMFSQGLVKIAEELIDLEESIINLNNDINKLK